MRTSYLQRYMEKYKDDLQDRYGSIKIRANLSHGQGFCKWKRYVKYLKLMLNFRIQYISYDSILFNGIVLKGL